MSLIWLFTVPAFVMQVALSLHLGVTFNLKSPAAWATRLPFSRHSISLFSYVLIGINALVFFAPLFPMWRLFYEFTAYPLAVALILVPSFAFQLVRRVRSSVSGIVLTLIAVGAFALLTGIGVSRAYQPFWGWIPTLGPLPTNGIILGISLLAALAIDSSRTRLLKTSLSIGLGLSLFIGFIAYQNVRIRQTDFHRKISELESSSPNRKMNSERFRKQAETLTEPLDPTPEDGSRFTGRAELIRANELIKTFSNQNISRAEWISAWKDLANESSIRPSMRALFQEFPLIAQFNLIKAMILGIPEVTDLSPLERKDLKEEILKSIAELTETSGSLMQALVSVTLIGMMTDKKLIDGVSMEEVRALELRLRKIKEKLMTNEVRGSFELMRAPTDKRLRVVAKSIYEYDAKPTAEVVDQMVELVNRAKPTATH